jgi:xylan 1,4-beta-xylosidase
VTQASTDRSSTRSSDARTDWENRIGQRTDPTFGGDAPRLDPPAWVRAEAGGHQVTLTWAEVPGAVGYQVYAADSPHGDYEPLDHAGRDVLAVPHPPYADTTGTPGVERWYRVATLTDVHVEGELSEPISATALADDSAPVVVGVDASSPVGELPRPWRPMIGSEHLSHALSTDTTGGRVIGEDLTSALSAARQELGVTHVRAHAILCDDVGAYREVDGEPVHDFTGVDKVYDHLRSLDLYPVVELSFMPHDLASDPTKTVFDYGAIVSPPKDWQRWHDLVRDLTAHLAERYGLEDLVEHWSFEVWNEANLEVFWSGTPAEYLTLYDVTAAAVKAVDPRLRVGGPSSAASGWVEELLSHADESGAPVDFLTTHTYGSPPLDFRPALERHGREGVPIWWTEWGVTPTHFNEVSDAVFAGTFLLRGMASAMRERRIEALSYWVVSDHFEELGRPPELLHGGFGLRTVGELRKPRWWALALLERLGHEQVAVDLAGDGAGSLVEALAATDASGGVTVLTWNLTLDQTKASGAPELSRRVRVELTGLAPSTAYALRHERVDDDHSDIAAVWGRLRDDGQAWPTESQWAALREADRLDVLAPDEDLTSDADGTLVVEYDLPMPAMSLLTLTPSPAG